MFTRKKMAITASTICLVTVTLFLQIGVFANQTTTTAGDFTVEAEAYDVFYDCNRDGKVDMLDIFGCVLRYGTEGDAVRTSYISIPPAAFNPKYETQSYQKHISHIIGSGVFYADARLPHGATITGMTVWITDNRNDGAVDVRLYRGLIGGSYSAEIWINSGVAETPGTWVSISAACSHVVDNSDCAYHLFVEFDYEDSLLKLHRVFIEYEYTP